MKKAYISHKVLITLAFFIMLIDQLSKYFAINLLKENFIIKIIPNLIQLRLARNTGAAFSILSERTSFLSFISLFFTMSIIIWLLRSKLVELWLGTSLSFLLGGTIGNGIDRFRLGYVNDFIEIVPINFPIFNFADIAINIGLIFFLVDIIKKKNEESIF
ncbi:signal peptidase II [Prochlorococcus sp. MIT 1223]|uniref:signal peptidase II n=1 Tax=Prochlorococcus sp. MIT 1223 TaxID=3096217 RepID=UPI002A753C6F|nr:signal peptidase II [Prochlorococcus sp. MIT 1223]